MNTSQHLSRSFNVVSMFHPTCGKKAPLVANHTNSSITSITTTSSTRKSAMTPTMKRLMISTTTKCPSLISIIPPDTLSTIRALPEVSQALESTKSRPDGTIVDGLQRAADVFQQLSVSTTTSSSSSTSSKCIQGEYKAVRMLQAQIYMDLNQYENALEILTSLTKLDSLTQEELFDLSIVMVRMYFYHGSFESAIQVAQEMCDLAPQLSHHDHVTLSQGTALNALGVSKLASVPFKDVHVAWMEQQQQQQQQRIAAEEEVEVKPSSNHDDKLTTHHEFMRQAQEATDLLRMASKLLESKYREDRGREMSTMSGGESHHPSPIGFACAASFCNQGVGELITSLMRSQCVADRVVPIDSAMNAWRAALNVLEEMEVDASPLVVGRDEKKETFLSRCKAHVYCNMAWGILFSSDYMVQKGGTIQSHGSGGGGGIKEESLKLASEYAGNALKIFSNNTTTNNDNMDQDMGRALNMVASCYARAGSAVTAEGLLKSAMDVLDNSSNPLRIIDARSTFLYYSKLCSNWEKRQADATKYAKMAMDIDQSDVLPQVWRSQSSILSGVYIFSKDEL